MERLTISLDDELASQFDDFLKEHGYKNRSEGMRAVSYTHLTLPTKRIV